jgi:NADH:ubiquinone oxidoreductase subunit F (NADH-binding)/NADH:ubiquinone oxidoreductase subunit E/Pyruvate/2-oxoacid:ferredoxin oxidoreductase delta subunit
LDLSYVDEAIARLGTQGPATIPILQAIQEHYGYLPPQALELVCRKTAITPAQIAGVSTFYSQFRHRPAGTHLVSVCDGTACHVKGATLVVDALNRELGLSAGQDTDKQGLFTVQKVACLGCCTLAPVVQIDGVTFGHVTPDRVKGVLADFIEMQNRRKESLAQQPPAAGDGAGEIRIGLGSCCVARGSADVQAAARTAIARTGIKAHLKSVGCVGMCHQTPLLEIVLPGREPALYAQVRGEDVQAILLRHFRPRGLLAARSGASRLLDRVLTDEAAAPDQYMVQPREGAVASFLGAQRHLSTELSGQINPTDLDEYLSHGGFDALKKCLRELPPQAVIDEVLRSGLRGRGGAGYPTGLKWQTVRNATVGRALPDTTGSGAVSGHADVGPCPTYGKYVICNCDEGDPGAFMDRMLLESYPFRVIEGVAIAAYAVGASHAIFYIRAEYPLAVQRVQAALDACLTRKLIGPGAFDGKLDIDIRIMQGAGAFVCGEETALIASLEGRRGMPRLRPPYPATHGLWGMPTLVNNTETCALVPWIVRNGHEAFAALGTQKSKGTKVFALAGKIARGGLIEVPMGVSLRQIVEDIGGGCANGKRFKAAQVGGPSGGCVPAELADIAVDYEALVGAGAMMGSGGLVILDEDDCIVEIARYFLEFTQDQSCGRCTFCRIGTRRMLDILERICRGEGKTADLEQLESLARQVQQGSLCGLGKTAPNPVLSTLKYFRPEYEAHIAGRCPAGKCKAMIHYVITDKCIGCTVCAQHCPADAIAMRPYERHEIDQDKCIRCNTCKSVCPQDAVKVE